MFPATIAPRLHSNVAIGRGALRNDVGGINLVAIGDSALYNNLGDMEAEEGLQNKLNRWKMMKKKKTLSRLLGN